MTERNKFDASEATMQDSNTQTTMEIDLVNKGSGVTYAKVPVVGGNTMGRVRITSKIPLIALGSLAT